MHVYMRLSLLSLAILAFNVSNAFVEVEVMPSEIQPRSYKIPTTLMNITRHELVLAGSAPTTRDLDLTARGPSGVSAYIEHTKRQNINGAVLWGAVASGLASGLATSCSIGTVLSFGSACIANLVLFLLTFAVANFFLWTPPNRRSLASDTVWNVDPQYVPTIDCGLRCTLAASAPRDKFATFGNITTDGNFYHLAYYHHSNNTLQGLRVTRNATLSSAASNTKRQEQGDLYDAPGSDGLEDYTSYVYWGESSQAANDEWTADFAYDDSDIANAYADYVVANDARVACMTTSESNEGVDLTSLWYFSESPGIEYEAAPDEVEGLMELCYSLG